MIKHHLISRSLLHNKWIEMENHLFKGKRSMVVPRRKPQHQVKAGLYSKYELCKDDIEPAENLNAYTIWLHGQAGIGKTSLSAMFPQSHLFCAGGQAKALRAKYVVIQSWTQFSDLVDQFKQSSFKTATIDLVEVLYDMCFEHVLKELNIDYPGKTSSGKEDFGKSWFFIRKEFARVVSKLMSMDSGQGLVLVSNSIHGERTVEEGNTVEDVHPNLSARVLNFISGAVDIIGFYTLNGKGERVLTIQPKPGLMAKCRIDHRFKYTNGKSIESIPMGKSKEEAYKNFVLAFENKLVAPVIKKTMMGKKK